MDKPRYRLDGITTYTKLYPAPARTHAPALKTRFLDTDPFKYFAEEDLGHIKVVLLSESMEDSSEAPYNVDPDVIPGQVQQIVGVPVPIPGDTGNRLKRIEDIKSRQQWREAISSRNDPTGEENQEYIASVKAKTALLKVELAAKREENRTNLMNVKAPSEQRLRRSYMEESSKRLQSIQSLSAGDTSRRQSSTNETVTPKKAYLEEASTLLALQESFGTSERRKNIDEGEYEEPQFVYDPPAEDEEDPQRVPILDDVQLRVVRLALEREPDYNDCGLPGADFTLSRKHARILRKSKHLGFFGLDGAKHSYTLTSSFGHHALPLGLDQCSEKREDNYVQAGLGVSLYFKLLKALLLLFAVVAVITLPSVVLLAMASRLPNSAIQKAFAPISFLSATSLASALPPSPICRQAQDGDPFAFKCPTASTIQSVIAHYGQPSTCASTDFSAVPALHVTPHPLCDAPTASLIATALCAGAPSCSFQIEVSTVSTPS